MSERDYAKMEASRIHCADEYLSARFGYDDPARRKLFEAGHDAGWKAMQTERDELLAALKIISEDCPHVEYDPDCTGTGNADDAYNHGSEMARSAIGEQLRAAIAKVN